jgi:hypothetical protein
MGYVSKQWHPATANLGSFSYDTRIFEPLQDASDNFRGRKTRRVDDLRIRRGPKRRYRAIRVTCIPLRNVPRKVAQANINPLFFQLLMASRRALVRGGG